MDTPTMRFVGTAECMIIMIPIMQTLVAGIEVGL